MKSSSPGNRLLRRLPAARGGLLALAAAVLYGISTPLVQKFGSGVGAFTTAALAWRMYHETTGGRVRTAMVLLFAGGVLLVRDQARDGGTGLWGLPAVLVATAAWGVDGGTQSR